MIHARLLIAVVAAALVTPNAGVVRAGCASGVLFGDPANNTVFYPNATITCKGSGSGNTSFVLTAVDKDDAVLQTANVDIPIYGEWSGALPPPPNGGWPPGIVVTIEPICNGKLVGGTVTVEIKAN